MPNLSNNEKATELARAYDLITQADIKIDDYSLRPPFFTIEISYQRMPEKQVEIANTLAIKLPEILKKFTAIQRFNTTLAANFIDLISVYKFASTIPFTELISVSEKIINPNNTQIEVPIKKFLVQRLTELLTTKLQSNGMTEELQQTALRMLEICKHPASNICSSEQTDFFTRLQLTATTLANTTLSSFANPVTTTNASIASTDTYSTSSELESTYPMSVELTNTTITSEPTNMESRRFSPLFLGTRLGLESGLGLAHGLTLFANDKLFKRFEGENPSFLRKIPSITSRSIISTAINLGRYPISGRIVNPFQIEDCAENLVIYFGSNLITSTILSSSIVAIHSTIEKMLGRGHITQLIKWITHMHTISIAMLVMSEDFQENPGAASLGLAVNWLASVASYLLMKALFPTPALEKTTSFYKNFGEEPLPIDSSSVSDKNSCASDNSINTHYFITEKKLNEIKKGLALIMDNLSNLHSSYVEYKVFLMQTKEKLPESVSNKTINEINLKIELIEKSIEQLNLYKIRLEDDHSAACIAFASDSELVTNKPVNGLHALLKEIKRILTELNSKLDKINGVLGLPDEIQTPIDCIRNRSESITSLITTLFTKYDTTHAGVKAEKKLKDRSFFTPNSLPINANDNSSNNEEEPIYNLQEFRNH